MSNTSTLVFPSLTRGICADLKELANPAGSGQLSASRLLEVTQALGAAQRLAQATAKQVPRADALDYLALEQAFAAALATVETTHQAS